jgi:hypothetical protein
MLGLFTLSAGTATGVRDPLRGEAIVGLEISSAEENAQLACCTISPTRHSYRAYPVSVLCTEQF